MVDLMSDLKLENKYVFILAAIQFAHIVDFVVLMPLGPTLMVDFKISTAQFGSLVSSYNFSAAIAGLLFSTVADRFESKRMLNLSMAGFIIGTVLCGMAPTFSLLLAGRILTGVFGGVLNILVFSLVANLVPYQRRGRAMGTVMASFSASSVLGIPVGLAIADFISWHWTFFFIAIMSGVIALYGHRILPRVEVESKPESMMQSLRAFAVLLQKKDYLLAYTMILLMTASMFLLIPFLSPYSVNNIGIRTDQLKYMYFIAGLCTVLSARYIGRMTDTLGALKVFATLAILSSVPIWIYTHVGQLDFTTYLILSTFFMTIVSGRMIPAMTMVSEVPLAKERGTFMGLLNSIRSFGMAMATMIGGMIITQSSSGKIEGFGNVGLITIAVTIFSIFLAMPVYKKIKLQTV